MGEAKRALITGIAGGLARHVARRLHAEGYAIVGVDYRRPAPLDIPAELHQAAYHRTRCADVIRRFRPTHVLHLGRVGDLSERMSDRFNLNVLGGQRILDYALEVGARRMVVLSTFHIYGAHPQNHVPIAEDEPLRAGTDFPEIADAIQLDTRATIWAYQHREVPTVVLRPTNVIGPAVRNAMSSFLRLPRVPVPMGFDPMTQFVHEDDLTEAIARMTESDAIGVVNVPGPYPIPWRRALAVTGARVVPVPDALLFSALRVAGAFRRTPPAYLINFFKYPCVIDGAKLEATLGWAPAIEPERAIRETLSSTAFDGAVGR
ncbi:MAG: NAD-dependent epimerase/dehydratase family protein [Sandaracinaceae bacterium]